MKEYRNFTGKQNEKPYEKSYQLPNFYSFMLLLPVCYSPRERR